MGFADPKVKFRHWPRPTIRLLVVGATEGSDFLGAGAELQTQHNPASFLILEHYGRLGLRTGYSCSKEIANGTMSLYSSASTCLPAGR